MGLNIRSLRGNEGLLVVRECGLKMGSLSRQASKQAVVLQLVAVVVQVVVVMIVSLYNVKMICCESDEIS